ncbi:type II secretion system major pseudopilin GspG [Porticoccus sp. W117]|uniref:type II secretion system major pseudopilin GspG n=1 Tax=Porticoccus sp. W117 TaxID=3054777 RepID=UPI002595EF7C|nr:type II secretion system major pseudopilin GspG [Porticoccus sp. W117]MDM3872568.1 type II secretion system major pseudopilin GspG [Porticoccus sp. W117]
MRNKQTGFTLIEIMVVVVIIGILGALVVPQFLGRADETKFKAAQSDIRSIGNALDLYRLDNHNYPSTDQGLDALVSRPSGFPEAKNWNPDGYLKKMPNDPWGNSYQYLSPGSNGKYDLFSYGADGKEGGEGYDKDINSWEL